MEGSFLSSIKAWSGDGLINGWLYDCTNGSVLKSSDTMMVVSMLAILRLASIMLKKKVVEKKGCATFSLPFFYLFICVVLRY